MYSVCCHRYHFAVLQHLLIPGWSCYCSHIQVQDTSSGRLQLLRSINRSACLGAGM